jgi:hypothetical protein
LPSAQTVVIADLKHRVGSEIFADIFGKSDYSRILRDKFKEINKVDIEYWTIEYTFIRSRESETNLCEIN